MRNVRTNAGVALLAAAGAVLAVQAVQAQQVGTAAAVNPAAQARGSGGSRTIVIGQSIAHRERIQTTSAGSVQLLFLDKTSMTIGPNSDLAIDEYVYDPATNTGKLAATLSKGVMRFVGGQISHSGNAEVTTPNAVVGIRGGVAIFQTTGVFVGYGQGDVRSGGNTVTLGANEFTLTRGGGAPPTPPGPPPENFLRTVLATLQSQIGQGGGSRATAGQVNSARTAATGSSTGNIATGNVQNVNQTINTANQANQFSQVNQTIQTTTAQTQVQQQVETAQPENLTGLTAGLSRLFSSSQQQQQQTTGHPTAGFATFQTTPANQRAQATFLIESGRAQFGSIDPNLPASSVTINGFDDVVGTTTALLPAVDSNGRQLSTGNDGRPLARGEGLLVEFQRGSTLTNSARQALGGTAFCDCDYTRWGFWKADVTYGGPSAQREQFDMFWVAGRTPAISEVPTGGIATYVGHAAAQIQNGSLDYAVSGGFENTVNFGTRTGQFTVTNLDRTNYTGTIAFIPNDPRLFVGAGRSTNERSIALVGNFFNGRTSPVGEMGGALLITNGNLYNGAGVFLGRMR